jgi:hypothetical protein
MAPAEADARNTRSYLGLHGDGSQIEAFLTRNGD